MLDRDDDGYITVQELEKALSGNGKGFSDAEIAEIMKIADTNQDGKIDYNGTCYTPLITIMGYTNFRQYM